jgi:hypothetical protein
LLSQQLVYFATTVILHALKWQLLLPELGGQSSATGRTQATANANKATQEGTVDKS